MSGVSLHFDINKTVLMIDTSGGKELGDAINSAIAESVPGTIDGNDQWTHVNTMFAHVKSRPSGKRKGENKPLCCQMYICIKN